MAARDRGFDAVFRFCDGRSRSAPPLPAELATTCAPSPPPTILSARPVVASLTRESSSFSVKPTTMPPTTVPRFIAHGRVRREVLEALFGVEPDVRARATRGERVFQRRKKRRQIFVASEVHAVASDDFALRIDDDGERRHRAAEYRRLFRSSQDRVGERRCRLALRRGARRGLHEHVGGSGLDRFSCEPALGAERVELHLLRRSLRVVLGLGRHLRRVACGRHERAANQHERDEPYENDDHGIYCDDLGAHGLSNPLTSLTR